MTTPHKRNTPKARLAGLLSVAALIVSICPAASAEEALGRLFFSPERRQTLDRQRQFNIQEKQEVPEDPTLTINGVVTRSSGKRTVWINGVAQNESETVNGLSIITGKNTPGTVTVQAESQPAASTKVGDTVNRATGESTSALGTGRISVKKTK